MNNNNKCYNNDKLMKNNKRGVLGSVLIVIYKIYKNLSNLQNLHKFPLGNNKKKKT